MSRAAFRQADVQRIIRAAGREGAVIEVDIRTLNFRIIAGANRALVTGGQYEDDRETRNYAPDGEEHWDDYRPEEPIGSGRE